MAVGAQFGAWLTGRGSLPASRNWKARILVGPARPVGGEGAQPPPAGAAQGHGGHAACGPVRKAQSSPQTNPLLFILQAEARAGISWSPRPPRPQGRELRGASPPDLAPDVSPSRPTLWGTEVSSTGRWKEQGRGCPRGTRRSPRLPASALPAVPGSGDSTLAGAARLAGGHIFARMCCSGGSH